MNPDRQHAIVTVNERQHYCCCHWMIKKKLSVYVLYCWFNELIKGEGAAYITLFIYAFFIRNASGYLNLSDKGIQKKNVSQANIHDFTTHS